MPCSTAGPELLKFQTFKDENQYEGTEVTRPASGMTHGERALFYVVVVAGKLAVALLILVGGTGLVLRAGTNYDLLLNAVAAAFVLELDEVIYNVLVPNSLKKTPSGTCMLPLGFSRKEVTETWQYRHEGLPMLSFWFKVGLIAMLRFASRAYWCEADTESRRR